MFRAALILSVIVLTFPIFAANWQNVDKEHHFAGRKASAGYLLGKTVMVHRADLSSPECREILPRLEAIWTSFRNRPFVLLGGYTCGGVSSEKAKARLKPTGTTYPIYEDAGLAEGEPRFAPPFFFYYVVDPLGHIRYKGRSERQATDTLVTLLTDYDSPRNLKQWQAFLEFEIKNLPGRAALRFAEFKKKFPAEGAAYASEIGALSKLPGHDDLVKLVAAARKLVDCAPQNAVERKKLSVRIKDTIAKYAKLKENADPRIVQEAKNALADLQWAAAEL